MLVDSTPGISGTLPRAFGSVSRLGCSDFRDRRRSALPPALVRRYTTPNMQDYRLGHAVAASSLFRAVRTAHHPRVIRGPRYPTGGWRRTPRSRCAGSARRRLHLDPVQRRHGPDAGDANSHRAAWLRIHCAPPVSCKPACARPNTGSSGRVDSRQLQGLFLSLEKSTRVHATGSDRLQRPYAVARRNPTMSPPLGCRQTSMTAFGSARARILDSFTEVEANSLMLEWVPDDRPQFDQFDRARTADGESRWFGWLRLRTHLERAGLSLALEEVIALPATERDPRRPSPARRSLLRVRGKATSLEARRRRSHPSAQFSPSAVCARLS